MKIVRFTRYSIYLSIYQPASQPRTSLIKFAPLSAYRSPRSRENLKLCDFGTARVLGDERETVAERIGTLSYAAPEVLIAPLDRANFTGLVLECIEAKFCK